MVMHTIDYTFKRQNKQYSKAVCDDSVNTSKTGINRKKMAGVTFTDKTADLVSKEYPASNEQASVLTSKVLYLIEQEITKNLDPFSTKTEINTVISEVAVFYDIAVEKLLKLIKPLLKKGAVKNIFMQY